LKSPHIPVLLNELLEQFKDLESGYFIDCTLGYAGHSKEILNQNSDINLIGIDRDIEAIKFSKERLIEFGDRVKIVQGSFSKIFPTIKEKPIRGVLADLGVSSLQLDKLDRGFNFNSKNLDMRMDKSLNLTAYDIVNSYSKDRLEYIFREYGEIKNPKRVVESILKNREIKSAKELTELIIKNSLKVKKINPATLYFQAIRIEVNQELREIELLLDNLEERAKRGELKGAKIAFITFHSLEDRIVKSHFKKWVRRCICPAENIRCECGGDNRLGKIITKKPIIASNRELKANPRSRSAKLRVFKFKE